MEHNAMTQFTKSFTRRLRVDGVLYEITQDHVNHMLTLKLDNAQDYLYKFIAPTNVVIYDDNQWTLIRRVLHQAQIDRYAVKGNQ